MKRNFTYLILLCSVLGTTIYLSQKQSKSTDSFSGAKIEQPKSPTSEVVAQKQPEKITTKVSSSQLIAKSPVKSSLQQRIEEAFIYNFEKIKNPVTGDVPAFGLIEALAKTNEMQLSNLATREEKIKWKERGPNNVGGRTRAILVDANDPTRKTVFVGSVSGGLWKTSDITVANPVWVKINDFLENLAIGAIGQDPVNPQIMYIGTGEVYGNLDAVRGVGIFKSTDGGNTWTLLPSTKTTNFRYTQRILFHPVSNNLLVATDKGLFNSKDGGQTWTQPLTSKIFDLEWSPLGYVYASNPTNIYRSATADPSSFTNLTNVTNSGFLKNTNLARVEFNICNRFPNVIYAIGSIGGAASNVYKSSDGGVSWTMKGKTSSNASGDITNGQAWYDLTIAVDPNDSSRVFVGGVPLGVSTNNGTTFSNVSSGMHVDQHVTMFDNNDSNVMYYGNDGGIYRSTNAGTSALTIQSKNRDYNTSQFYACALHPGKGSNYFLGGTQDNNSLKMNSPNVGGSTVVRGGDGMFCHIDQQDPNIQVVCSQFANYSASYNGGANFSGGANLTGDFVAPSDYDNFTGIMYSQSDSCHLYKWPVRAKQAPVKLTFSNGLLGTISAIHCDPTKANRVYVGFGSGRILLFEDVSTGTTISGLPLTILPSSGSVSSIEVDPRNENHLIVTCSNYGLSNNIFESKDKGQTWIGVEGTALPAGMRFPDMPVRWAIFSPTDSTKAIIATEAGVWHTERLNGDSTQWIPPALGEGTPLVRTDMLQYRLSDNVVLAGTHGRGMWTTADFVGKAIAAFTSPDVLYTNKTAVFTNNSANADSYSWDFGDGATSTEENPAHSFANIGEYQVKLSINNGAASVVQVVKVLPDLGLPYQVGQSNYGGGFDQNAEQYGISTISGGSGWQIGKSNFENKNGTVSGSNAAVTDLQNEYYLPNSTSYLYLPNFDMKEKGIYEFSFSAKYRFQNGVDGFNVEYSTDKGDTWKVLGSANATWYNVSNVGGVFGDLPFFSGELPSFKKYTMNVSNLSGTEVAIRFVFKSDALGFHNGAAIDNVEITKYTGVLKTTVIEQNTEFTASTTMKLTWRTLPEFRCKKFIIEWSSNGRDFEEIGSVNATGITTANPQSYTFTNNLAVKCLYFVRIKIVDLDEAGNEVYSYTPIMILRKETQCSDGLFNIYPNPIKDEINLVFGSLQSGNLNLKLFAYDGRLIAEETIAVSNEYYVNWKPQVDLPKGTYLLRLQINENEPTSTKISVVRE